MKNQISNYKSLRTGMLCNEKIALYNKTARDLTMKVMGCSQRLKNTESIILNNIDKFTHKDIKLTNVGLSANKHNIKTNPCFPRETPKCLLDDFEKISRLGKGDIKDSAKKISGMFRDLIKEEAGALAKGYIDEIIDAVQKSEIVTGVLTKTESILKEVGNLISLAQKSIDLILDAPAKIMFSEFELIDDIFKEVKINKNMMILTQIKECVRTHCLEGETLEDISDLFTANGVLKLPVDIYTGEFRPFKMSLLSGELGQDQFKNSLAVLDKDYSTYSTIKSVLLDNLFGELKQELGWTGLI